MKRFAPFSIKNTLIGLALVSSTFGFPNSLPSPIQATQPTIQDNTPVKIQSEKEDRGERRSALSFENFLQRLPQHDILLITEAFNQDNSKGKERQRFSIENFTELGLSALSETRRPVYETIHTDYFPRKVPKEELEEFQRTGLTSMEDTPQMCLSFLSYPYHPSSCELAREGTRLGFEVKGMPKRQQVKMTEILDPIEQISSMILAGGENLSRSIKDAMPEEEVAELEKIVYRLQTDEEYTISVSETIIDETTPGTRSIIYTRGLTAESKLPFMISDDLRENYGLRTIIIDIANPSVDIIAKENREEYESFLRGRKIESLRSVTAVPISERHHVIILPPIDSK